MVFTITHCSTAMVYLSMYMYVLTILCYDGLMVGLCVVLSTILCLCTGGMSPVLANFRGAACGRVHC